MDIKYIETTNLIAVENNIKRYELVLEFIHKYNKLCVYYCTFEIKEDSIYINLINSSIRIIAPEDWAISNTTLINNDNNLQHNFYFYRQKSKIKNKEFYQSFNIITGKDF